MFMGRYNLAVGGGSNRLVNPLSHLKQPKGVGLSSIMDVRGGGAAGSQLLK
jgi:hypothetical protein